jgi:Aspartyl protease
MAGIKWFASVVLGMTMVSALNAETGCPGNVDSLPLRFVNHHQMIVRVSVNHSGPYDFLLDTGTQVSLVDPSLAAELHLESAGVAVVAALKSRQSAAYANLDLLEVGSHAIANHRVLVYNFQNLRGALDIQGVLGEDLLEHFDMLIDNVHKLLCLDNSGALRAAMRGPHTALVSPSEITGGSVLGNLIIVEARLSDATRPLRLMLDSGSNGAILFNTREYLNPLQRGQLEGTGMDGAGMLFSALPPQDVKIGPLRLRDVPFVSLAGTQKDSRNKGFDGVLTLGLFRRVFIASADHFAILEPR